MRISIRVVAAFVALAAGTGRASNLPAQTEDENAIEEIGVIEKRQAYRGDFSPMETPESLLELDAAVLEQAGVRDLDAALDLAASVARQNNFGGLWNSFALRGFVGDDNLPSGYLVNGFNAGRGFSGPRDISGIDRVEILKGPKAAVYGRGEPGGAVNLVTKRPRFESLGELRVSGGSYESWRADADWTGPVSDFAAIRLVGFFEDANSFRDTLETRRYGASPSLLLHPSQTTTLIYEVEATRQEIPFDRGVVAVDGRLGTIPRDRFLGEPADGPLEAQVLGHQLEFQQELNDDWSLLAGLGYRDTSLEGFSSEPELTESRQRLLVDGRTLTRQRRWRGYDSDYTVLRAEITGDFELAGLRHRVLAGADADRFDNTQVFLRYRAPALAADPTPEQSYVIDVLDPVYGQFPLPDLSPLTNRRETQEAVGIYVQDQVVLSDRLQVRLGGRYDDFTQKIDNRLSGSASKQSDSRVSPQVGFVYEAGDGLSLYATYGEGFRPLSGTDFAGRAFDPNDSRSIEGGLRFQLRDGALSGTASVFSIKQQNILAADPVNAGFQLAAGEAESRGFELDVAGELPRDILLWLSYAYVDAEISNDLLDPNFGLQIDAGDRLLNVPKHTLTLQVAREWYLNGQTLTVGGNLLHVGDRLGETATDFMLPDYTLVRAFAAYDVSDRFEIRGEIDNLFDETWYASSFSQLWVRPGTPRTARLSASFRFGERK